METFHKWCAGLNVHKVHVVTCLRLVSKRKMDREVHRSPTTTLGLLALAEWLGSARCTHVAMEATTCTGSRSDRVWNGVLRSRQGSVHD
jgi:transposase